MTGAAMFPAFMAECALLALAGVFKLRSPHAACASLAQIGVPAPALAVRAVGAAELALGALAMVRPQPLTAVLVAGAYACFFLVMLRLLAVDGSADCGCFGAASSVASRAHATACALACAAAVLAALFPPAPVSWIVTRAPLVAGTLTFGTVAAVFAAYAVFTLFAPAWRAYGSGESA